MMGLRSPITPVIPNLILPHNFGRPAPGRPFRPLLISQLDFLSQNDTAPKSCARTIYTRRRGRISRQTIRDRFCLWGMKVNVLQETACCGGEKFGGSTTMAS